jgi:hypothetical protein
MTRDEIIKMAQEAGEAEGMEVVFHPVMARFATLVAAAEREACLRECKWGWSSADIEIAIRARETK